MTSKQIFTRNGLRLRKYRNGTECAKVHVSLSTPDIIENLEAAVIESGKTPGAASKILANFIQVAYKNGQKF